MDKIVKSSASERERPPLFLPRPDKADLEKYFEVLKRDENIYYAALEHQNGKHELFIGVDYTMRFFLTAEDANIYRESVQVLVPQMKFVVIRFQAVNGVAKGIADVKTAPKAGGLAVSTYKNGNLIDIDHVYKTKQLLN